MLSEEIDRLLRSLHQPPSLLERLRRDDRRRDCLKSLAASGDFRIVPVLLPFLTANDSLSEDAARTIARLVHGIGPAGLAWIDEQARSYSCTYSYELNAWWKLPPAAVPALVRKLGPYTGAIGVLASHPNGFVREAAVKQLGASTDGQETPFLVLRANDWVRPVAATAGELLARRLVPDNRRAVLAALPFIVRMLGQRRYDHGRFSDLVMQALLSDGCRDALESLNAFDTPVRRFVHELMGAEPAAGSRMIRAALADSDPVVRKRAVSRVWATGDSEASTKIVERLTTLDPVPSVRKEALSVLAARAPGRLSELLPRVLLDRAAGVRELARFYVRDLNAELVPRRLYVDHLNSASPRQLAVAIEGVGETGTSADLDLLNTFRKASTPRIRRAALRASAKLDADRAVSLAAAALEDVAPSVRAAAVNILRRNARQLDFAVVSRQLKSLSDARAREAALPLLREAPKWDAAAFLLEALADPEPSVRRKASQLLDAWVANFNRSQAQPDPRQLRRIRELLDASASEVSENTARLLRFSVKAD